MSSFRFLHVADVHLDSPLLGLSRYEGVPAAQVRMATREAFENVVDAALREQVQFVLIAGDLYDGDWDDFSTGLFLCRQLGRLRAAHIPVFLIYGNHDARSVITKKLPLPWKPGEFGHEKAGSHYFEELQVAIHGQSFKDRAVPHNLAARYPDPRSGWYNIGLLHTSLTGAAGHDTYAPCTADDLRARGYDYWALGHIHARSIVSRDPYIVFSGNVQGRNIRETGPKGAMLVTVENGKTLEPEHLALDVVRWAEIPIEVERETSLDELFDRVRDELTVAVQDQAGDRPLLVRLVLNGATPLHAELVRDRAALRAGVQSVANALAHPVWLEKILVSTIGIRAPALDSSLALDLASMLNEHQASDRMNVAIRAALEPFLNKLPRDLSETSTLIAQVRAGELTPLFDEVTAALTALFTTERG